MVNFLLALLSRYMAAGTLVKMLTKYQHRSRPPEDMIDVFVASPLKSPELVLPRTAGIL
jgi:hypothetical protein